MELEDYENALSDFSKAIEVSPKDYRPLIWRGIVYMEFEDHKNALSDFSEVIELDPNNFSSYYWRGKAKAALKEHEEAAWISKEEFNKYKFAEGDKDIISLL